MSFMLFMVKLEHENSDEPRQTWCRPVVPFWSAATWRRFLFGETWLAALGCGGLMDTRARSR